MLALSGLGCETGMEEVKVALERGVCRKLQQTHTYLTAEYTLNPDTK